MTIERVLYEQIGRIFGAPVFRCPDEVTARNLRGSLWLESIPAGDVLQTLRTEQVVFEQANSRRPSAFMLCADSARHYAAALHRIDSADPESPRRMNQLRPHPDDRR